MAENYEGGSRVPDEGYNLGSSGVNTTNAWWRDMTEAQRDFWYAARERDTALALSRRLKAGKWFMWPALYMLFTLWVWVIREMVEANGREAEIWWNGVAILVALTLIVGRGFWLWWVTYRDNPQRSDEGDGFTREYGRNRGVGDEVLPPG